MKAIPLLGNLHRQIIPFTLALRVIGITTPSSLAVAAELPAVPQITTSQYANQFTEQDFLALTNSARAQSGLAPLSLNGELEQAAMAKAQDMANNHYWDHFRPTDKKAPWDFIHESGYQYTVAGENLARGFTTPTGITNAWMESPTHRANVLSPKYTEVGFASIRAAGTDGQTVLLTVQMFGSR
jgi:uncharacterized protein YkwD